jgi:hypothetical protein
MSKTVNGTTTGYAWDQSSTLPLLIADGTDFYIYGPGGQPIEKITGTTVTYLHQDGRLSQPRSTDHAYADSIRIRR